MKANRTRPLARPAAPKNEPKTSRRDWLAVGISLFSLACTGLTAYYNVLLQKDDIRIVVSRLPDMSRDERGNMFASGGIELTILNAGNRAAVVTQVSTKAYQRETKSGIRECKNPHDERPFPVNFFIDFKPVVVKPGEIQFVSAKLRAMFPWNQPKKSDREFFDMSLPTELHGKNVDHFLMCLEVSVTAPDSSSIKWIAPMAMMSKTNVQMDYLPEQLYEQSKPITVLKRQQTIFGY